MLEWHVVNSATYYAAESASLNSDFLYFLSDTKEIYKGAVPFSQAVEMLSAPDYTLPTTPARKRIYVNPSNLEGKIYDGSQWVTVIKPVSTAVTENDANPVSGGAVKTYVDDAIADLAASDDVMASLGQAQGNGAADTTAGAGDQYGFSHGVSSFDSSK